MAHRSFVYRSAACSAVYTRIASVRSVYSSAATAGSSGGIIPSSGTLASTAYRSVAPAVALVRTMLTPVLRISAVIAIAICSSATMVVFYCYTPIVSIDIRSSGVIIAVGSTKLHIRTSYIISIRGIPRIAYGAVIPSVWRGVNITKVYGWPSKPSVVRSVYISAVVYVNIAGSVAKTTAVPKNI